MQRKRNLASSLGPTLLLCISSAHLEILRFPMGGAPTNTGIILRSLKLCGESRT